MCRAQFLVPRRAKAASWIIVFFAAVVLCGCGKKTPYACVPTSGKVTYADGTLIPADQIQIVFVSQTPPTDPKNPPKKGTTVANGSTGAFDSVSTYGPKDGIVAGEHKVVIHCLRKSRLVKSLVPPEYMDETKTPLTVHAGKEPLELKVPKPR